MSDSERAMADEKYEQRAKMARAQSERDRVYGMIEAIGGMEELEKMVARKKSYGGYEAMVDAETRKLWDNAQDQDYKADAGKIRLSLVPVSGIEAVARVREYGVSKYHTEQGWDKVEIRRYVDALGRHFMEFLKDNNGVDSESGLPHMEHICCNAFFIIELMQRGEKRA